MTLPPVMGGRASRAIKPVLSKWLEQLLADHDERVRLERERKG